ncbi:MAG: hypothetical protein U0694_23190 [Anaerolineae bacterium]
MGGTLSRRPAPNDYSTLTRARRRTQIAATEGTLSADLLLTGTKKEPPAQGRGFLVSGSSGSRYSE